MPDKNIIIAALIIGGAAAFGLLKRFSIDVDTTVGNDDLESDIGFKFGVGQPAEDQTDPSRSSAPEPQTPPSVAEDEPKPRTTPIIVPNYTIPYFPYYSHYPYYGWPYGPYWRGWHRGWGRPYRWRRPWLARF